MGWRDLRLRLRALVARRRVERELQEELDLHLAREVEALVARGIRRGDARAQLEDPANDRFTIDAIAATAGFASRSAFYQAFKAAEGMPPTEFRARVRRRT